MLTEIERMQPEPERGSRPAGPVFKPRRRQGFLPRWAGFWSSAPLLVIALVTEGIYSLLRLVLFPFHAAATRRRIAGMIRGGVAALLGAIVTLGASCSSFPGSSFEKQVDELAWSTHVVFLDEPPAESLRMIGEDTREILLGTAWSELAWDIEQMFYDPKWYRSLRDDTADLVSWEAREFTENFEMLGW